MLQIALQRYDLFFNRPNRTETPPENTCFCPTHVRLMSDCGPTEVRLRSEIRRCRTGVCPFLPPRGCFLCFSGSGGGCFGGVFGGALDPVFDRSRGGGGVGLEACEARSAKRANFRKKELWDRFLQAVGVFLCKKYRVDIQFVVN